MDKLENWQMDNWINRLMEGRIDEWIKGWWGMDSKAVLRIENNKLKYFWLNHCGLSFLEGNCIQVHMLCASQKCQIVDKPINQSSLSCNHLAKPYFSFFRIDLKAISFICAMFKSATIPCTLLNRPDGNSSILPL